MASPAQNATTEREPAAVRTVVLEPHAISRQTLAGLTVLFDRAQGRQYELNETTSAIVAPRENALKIQSLAARSSALGAGVSACMLLAALVRRGATVAVSIGAVVVLLAALGPAMTASAAPGSEQASGATTGFWGSITLSESFTTMVGQIGKTSAPAVIATLKAMLSRVEAGHAVYIPQGTSTGIASVRASSAEIKQALAAAGASEGHDSESPSIPPPNEYPVRGEVCPKNDRAWCSLLLEFAVSYCDEDGCKLTDRMTVRITVDPGPKTSRASFNAIYSPDDHNYAGFHFQWWVLCFAAQRTCGSEDTDSFDRSEHGTFTMTSTTDLYDSKIAHAITLWGFFVRNGNYYNDDAKTGTATCESKPKNYCVY
jgi:hypothetical protein